MPLHSARSPTQIMKLDSSTGEYRSRGSPLSPTEGTLPFVVGGNVSSISEHTSGFPALGVPVMHAKHRRISPEPETRMRYDDRRNDKTPESLSIIENEERLRKIINPRPIHEDFRNPSASSFGRFPDPSSYLSMFAAATQHLNSSYRHPAMNAGFLPHVNFFRGNDRCEYNVDNRFPFTHSLPTRPVPLLADAIRQGCGSLSSTPSPDNHNLLPNSAGDSRAHAKGDHPYLSTTRVDFLKRKNIPSQ